jgi:hypothetical protein
LTASMRFLLLCALILGGCAAPQQSNSTDALAEQKQNMRAERAKQIEKENEQRRVMLRQLYVNEHPELSAAIRKAILKERPKVGMTMWDVVAAYSLWEYTSDPQLAKYRAGGVTALWTLTDRRQTGQAQEQWILQRKKDTQRLTFANGTLTAWND